MEQKSLCCAVIGQPPMCFPWGFDEEDAGCQNLKLELAQKIMEAASLRRTPECEYDAYRKIVDYADMVLAVCDPATATDDAADRAMKYAASRGLPVLQLEAQ